MYRRICRFLWVIGARFTMNFTLIHHAPSRPSFQYGSHVRAGHFEGCQPSCIYPEALKAVVRACFPDEQATKSKPDPEGRLVSTSIHTHISESAVALSSVGMAQGVSFSLYIGIGAKFQNTQNTGEKRLCRAKYRMASL